MTARWLQILSFVVVAAAAATVTAEQQQQQQSSQHFLRQQQEQDNTHHRELEYTPFIPNATVVAREDDPPPEPDSLNLCEGDCDKDSDCLGDLVCFQRDNGEAVPGCNVRAGIAARADFCINPKVKVVAVGTKPYGLCEANCTSDADCEGGLVCYGRGGGKPTPGCSGGEEISTRIGVCINPQPIVTGDNGKPASAYPFGKCQGDCDNDRDCGAGLICYQREGNDFIPGCGGGESKAARADYCTDAKYGPDTAESFKLKLYWETGYKWQGETTERKFCLSCRRTTCVAGIEAIIVECPEPRVNFITFVEQGSNDEVVMQLTAYPNLCLTRKDGTKILTAACNYDDPKQHFIAQPGTFDDPRFEITPKGASSLCVSLASNPKSGRVIFIQSCAAARLSNTSFWNKFEIQS